MQFKNTLNRLIVTTDGEQLFHSRSVAVLAVLAASYNGHYYYAIEKRGLNLDCPNLWCLPCGYLDWDETGSEAVRREVWEELGLDTEELLKTITSDINLDQPWFVHTDPSTNRQNVTLRYGFSFAVETLPEFSFKVEEGSEVLEAKWIRKSELDQYSFAFNHDKIIADFEQKFCVPHDFLL